MSNKGSNMKIIDIGYWSIIIITALYQVVKEIVEEAQFVNLSEINIDVIINIFGFFILAVLISAFMLFGLTIPYVGVKIAHKLYTKNRLDKVDFKNDKYYRELITKYSVGVLSYVDNFSLDEKDIVATLLSLELKKKIKIKDKIAIIDEKDEDLAANEKYIFNHLKTSTLNNINMYEFENEIRNDCIQSGLLETTKTAKQKKIKNIIISCIIYVGVILLFNSLQALAANVNMESNLIEIIFVIFSVLVFLALIIYPFAIIVSIIAYALMKAINPYVRTKGAKELNTKLEGLKKYITDFSLIEEKDKNDIILWEYYLVYSVMFGINTKVVNEVMEKIK